MGLGLFIKAAKSLGFCSGNKKIKQNKKLWLRAQTKTKSFLTSALRLAQALCAIRAQIVSVVTLQLLCRLHVKRQNEYS
ncbi:hypothetical protein SAMN05660866_03752 [Maribacter arcticus]|uniref:Uncharacterized protein n=1 Tax=Maribacter arcticus TaxID=561365 RepID=A0A1T5EX58_9FLAO|nr:hypothetical protein SAMN05660866_03752 [Maribacter arcticus]